MRILEAMGDLTNVHQMSVVNKIFFIVGRIPTKVSAICTSKKKGIPLYLGRGCCSSLELPYSKSGELPATSNHKAKDGWYGKS